MDLWIYFSVALILTFTIPAISPSLQIYYFIPFLVRCFYKKTFAKTLTIALIVGILLDTYFANSRFGLYGVNYFLTTIFLYSLKRHFFEDSFTTLPFMTYFFSVTSSIIQWMLILVLDKHYIPLTSHFILVDFFLMPLLDVLFAVLVTFPLFFFRKPIRKGTDYFLT